MDAGTHDHPSATTPVRENTHYSEVISVVQPQGGFGSLISFCFPHGLVYMCGGSRRAMCSVLVRALIRVMDSGSR